MQRAMMLFMELTGRMLEPVMEAKIFSWHSGAADASGKLNLMFPLV